MSARYDHTQAGALMRIVFGGFALVLLCVASGLAIAQKPPQVVLGLGGTGAFMTVVAFVFHSLNVRVEAEYVRLRFGIGLVRKKFKLADIEQVLPTQSHWYNGWGIKKVRHGWLFNVSGFGAVELKFKNAKRDLIGTDEPKQLAAATEAAKQAD